MSPFIHFLLSMLEALNLTLTGLRCPLQLAFQDPVFVLLDEMITLVEIQSCGSQILNITATEIVFALSVLSHSMLCFFFSRWINCLITAIQKHKKFHEGPDSEEGGGTCSSYF